MTFQDEYWRNHSQKLESRHKMALAMLPDGDFSILDVGAGDCLFINQVRSLDKTAMDISKEGLKNSGPNVLHCVCDFDKEWPSYTINQDVVSGLDVIEHTLNPVGLLQRMGQVGRVVLVTTPNFAFFPFRLQMLFGKVPSENSEKKGHMFFFTKTKLEEVIMRAGLEVLEWDFYILGQEHWLLKHFKWLLKRWPSLFASEFCCLLTKKGGKA